MPQATPLRVFVDLDGTLTDSRPGITRSIRHALDGLGVRPPPDDDLTWCVGPPLADSFALLLGGIERVPRAVELYRERFSTIGLYENRVQPGIAAALRQLTDAGAQLFVATSKPQVYARRIVEHLQLSPWFGAVFGAELDGTRADKADLLAWALRHTGGPAGPTVMVGDRRHDIDGARANGVAAVGVLWGYGDRGELEAAGAATLIAWPAELAAAVAAVAPG